MGSIAKAGRLRAFVGLVRALAASSSPTLDAEAARAARNTRLRELHGRCLELVFHESRLVRDRSSTFVSSNAILFTGFFLLGTQEHKNGWIVGFMLALSVLGTALCLVHPLLMARTVDALDFWRSTAALIEQDEDFWYPTKTERDRDLDVTLARARHWQGESTRQAAAPLRLSQVGKKLRAGRAIGFGADPNTFFALLLPAAIGLLWLGAAGWSVDSLVLLVAC